MKHVELKPKRLSCRSLYFFQRANAHRGQGEGQTCGMGHRRSLHLTTACHHARHTNRRQSDRHADALARQRRRRIKAGNIAQNTLLEPNFSKVRHVGREGELLIGTAVDVVKQKPRQPLFSPYPVVRRSGGNDVSYFSHTCTSLKNSYQPARSARCEYSSRHRQICSIIFTPNCQYPEQQGVFYEY